MQKLIKVFRVLILSLMIFALVVPVSAKENITDYQRMHYKIPMPNDQEKIDIIRNDLLLTYGDIAYDFIIELTGDSLSNIVSRGNIPDTPWFKYINSKQKNGVYLGVAPGVPEKGVSSNTGGAFFYKNGANSGSLSVSVGSPLPNSPISISVTFGFASQDSGVGGYTANIPADGNKYKLHIYKDYLIEQYKVTVPPGVPGEGSTYYDYKAWENGLDLVVKKAW